MQGKTMKALVKYAAGPGNMEIRTVPVPQPGPGQVRVKVMEAGICGSDLHIFHSDIAIPVKPPVVVGHEFSGVIDALGEGVTGWAEGDRVVSETAFHYCGKCDFCREGWYNLCVERKTLGYWYDGIFASYTVLPVDRLHAIPDNVDFVTAAMTEPLACVTHAVEDLCVIRPGDVALISGPGAIGLMAMQVAKAHGAKTVVSGTNVDKDRLALALTLGADRTVNIQEESLSDVLMGMTDGYGPDVVLECSGAAPAINSALRLIKKRGYFTQIGLAGKKIEFDIEALNYKEMHMAGSIGSRNASWRMALSLLRDEKVRLAPLMSHRFPITEWEKAFEVFESKQGLKLFLSPVQE